MTPILAVLGIDADLIAPINFLLLVAFLFIGDRIARGVKALHALVVSQAEEIVKLEKRAAHKSAAFEAMAARAESAAHEAARKADVAVQEAIRVAAEANREAIRVAAESEDRARRAAAEMRVELELIRGEWGRLHEARRQDDTPPHGIPAYRPEHDPR